MTVNSQSLLNTDNTSGKGGGIKRTESKKDKSTYLCTIIFPIWAWWFSRIHKLLSIYVLGQRDILSVVVKFMQDMSQSLKQLWILLQLKPGLYQNRKANPPTRLQHPIPTCILKPPPTPTSNPISQLCRSPAWPTTSQQSSHLTARWPLTPSMGSVCPLPMSTWCTQPWDTLVS